MRNTARRSAQWLLGLLISLFAFGLAFRGVDLSDVASALRGARYIYVLPALALIYLGLIARAQSWRTILGHGIPYWRVFDVLNEGYLLNNVLPLRLGELARAYLISRGRQLSTAQALSSVVVERVIDLTMVVAMLLAFLPLLVGLEWARTNALVFVAISLAGLGGLIGLARSRERVLRVVRWVLDRIPWLNTARWEARAHAFWDGLAMLQDGRRSLWAAFWSGLAWVAAGIGAWALLYVFLPSATPAMGFFALIIAGLGAALPSAPASAGVFEASVIAALFVFDVPGGLALAYAVLLHLLNFSLTSVLGAVALTREGETISHLAQAAQSLVVNRSAKSPVE